MKIVVQRVQNASVSVESEVIGAIESGLLLLVCFEQGDTDDALTKAIDKITKLRIFDDAEGKMNLDIPQVKGEILSVSQFTLSWDGTGGHRPSFEKSMPPQDSVKSHKAPKAAVVPQYNQSRSKSSAGWRKPNQPTLGDFLVKSSSEPTPKLRQSTAKSIKAKPNSQGGF